MPGYEDVIAEYLLRDLWNRQASPQMGQPIPQLEELTRNLERSAPDWRDNIPKREVSPYRQLNPGPAEPRALPGGNQRALNPAPETGWRGFQPQERGFNSPSGDYRTNYSGPPATRGPQDWRFYQEPIPPTGQLPAGTPPRALNGPGMRALPESTGGAYPTGPSSQVPPRALNDGPPSPRALNPAPQIGGNPAPYTPDFQMNKPGVPMVRPVPEVYPGQGVPAVRGGGSPAVQSGGGSQALSRILPTLAAGGGASLMPALVALAGLLSAGGSEAQGVKDLRDSKSMVGMEGYGGGEDQPPAPPDIPASGGMMPDRVNPYQSPAMGQLQSTPAATPQVAPALSKMLQETPGDISMTGTPTLDTSKRYGGAGADTLNSIESTMDSRITTKLAKEREEESRRKKYADMESNLVSQIGAEAGSMRNSQSPQDKAQSLATLKGLLPTWQNMFAARPVPKGGSMGTPTGDIIGSAVQAGGLGTSSVGQGYINDLYSSALQEGMTKFNDPIKAREHAIAAVSAARAGIAGASATATAVSGNTGAARDAKIGMLQSQNALKPLSEQEKKELAFADTLDTLSQGIIDMTGNFDRPYFGPLSGRVGNTQESLLGGYGMSSEEARVRREMGNIKDQLLRLRSGAQINEQEFQRLSTFLPDMAQLPHMNRARMEGFRNELRLIVENRRKYAKETRGGPQSVTPSLDKVMGKSSGGTSIKGQPTSKPDGQYQLQDGSTVTVKGGVIQ